MHESETKIAESRALTVVRAPSHATATVRRDAAFLAHLIATRAHAPQTCARRRAAPQEAVAAYLKVRSLSA